MQGGRTSNPLTKHLNIFVYGLTGSGKTLFGSTFPKPIIIECDRGERTLTTRNIDIPYLRPESWQDIEDFMESPENIVNRYHPGYAFESIIIDTVSIMEDFSLEEALKRPRPNVAMANRPDRQDFGYNFKLMNGFFKELRKLPYHTVSLAHAEVYKDETTGRTEGWPALIGKLRQRSLALSDIVLYFETELAGKGVDFWANSIPTRNFHARTRYPLPARFKNPTFEFIHNYIFKEKQVNEN